MEGLFQPTHLLLILAIVLILFGPGKLPDLGRDPLRIRMHGTEPIEAEWRPQQVEA